jgi:TonB family protein
VHVVIAGAVVAALNISLTTSEPVESYVDMEYETFDAPPEAAPPKVVETRSEELQDQQSEVAGTQEKKEETANGNQANNTPQPTTPYYKIKPKYPKAALIAGTEGWVLLEIDVNENGEVENVRVIDGEQRNMFQSEARRAVEQWKYRPFMDRDGKPMRKADHQVRVDFKLTDNEEESGS